MRYPQDAARPGFPYAVHGAALLLPRRGPRPPPCALGTAAGRLRIAIGSPPRGCAALRRSLCRWTSCSPGRARDGCQACVVDVGARLFVDFIQGARLAAGRSLRLGVSPPPRRRGRLWLGPCVCRAISGQLARRSRFILSRPWKWRRKACVHAEVTRFPRLHIHGTCLRHHAPRAGAGRGLCAARRTSGPTASPPPSPSTPWAAPSAHPTTRVPARLCQTRRRPCGTACTRAC